MHEHRPFKGTLKNFHSFKNQTPLHVLVCQSMACTRREKELHRTVKWSRDWWLVVVVGWIEGGLLSVTSSDPNTINNDRLFGHRTLCWVETFSSYIRNAQGCYPDSNIEQLKLFRIWMFQNLVLSYYALDIKSIATVRQSKRRYCNGENFLICYRIFMPCKAIKNGRNIKNEFLGRCVGSSRRSRFFGFFLEEPQSHCFLS